MNKVAQDTMDDVLALPMRNGIAVDGGAHVGRWTIAMCKKFEKVFAYEPQPGVFKMLEKNLMRVPGNYAACKALGWTAGGKVQMGLRLANKTDTARITGIGEGVEMTTLDRECAGKDIAFIKLDLEGFEYHALRGAEQTLRRCRPVVLIEEKDGLSEHFGVPTGEARRWLESIGMHVARRYPIDLLMEWA